MKAILVPYCCDQNEPSRPLRQIVTIPDNVKARNELLKALFEEVFETDEPEKLTVRKGGRNDYGDIVVQGPHELYLFVTIIDE